MRKFEGIFGDLLVMASFFVGRTFKEWNGTSFFNYDTRDYSRNPLKTSLEGGLLDVES